MNKSISISISTNIDENENFYSKLSLKLFFKKILVILKFSLI